jgi:hypothetical protein
MAGVTVNGSKAVISAGLLWNIVRRTGRARRAVADLVAIGIASAIVLSGNPAVAIDPSETCFGLTEESPDEDGAQLRIAHVVGDTSVELSFMPPPACEREPPNFCKNGESGSVQPGDIVVVTRQASGFICARRFPGGPRNEGWLPLSRLKIADPAQVATPLSAWVGTWHGSGATITIHLADNNTLRAEGEARWEGRYAGPNIGDFDATVRPVSNLATLTDDYSDDCHVSLALLPDSLAVVDNALCGGMIVRFSGFYERTSID